MEPIIHYRGPKELHKYWADIATRIVVPMTEASNIGAYKNFVKWFPDGTFIRAQIIDHTDKMVVINIEAPVKGGKAKEEDEIRRLVFVLFFAPLGSTWTTPPWMWDDLQLFPKVERAGRMWQDKKLYEDPAYWGILSSTERFKIEEYNYKLEELVRIGKYSKRDTGEYDIGVWEQYYSQDSINPGGAWDPAPPAWLSDDEAWVWYYSGEGYSWWYAGPWGARGWDELLTASSAVKYQFLPQASYRYRLIVYKDGSYSNIISTIEDVSTQKDVVYDTRIYRSTQPRFTPGMFGSGAAYPETYSTRYEESCEGTELVSNSGDIVSGGHEDLGYVPGQTWGIIFGRADHSWSYGSDVAYVSTDEMGATMTYTKNETWGEYPEPRHDIHYYLKVSDPKDGDFEFDLGDIITESSGKHNGGNASQRFSSQLIIYDLGKHPLYVFSTNNQDTGVFTYGYVYKGKFKRSEEFPVVDKTDLWNKSRHDFFGSQDKGLYGCGVIRAALEYRKIEE